MAIDTQEKRMSAIGHGRVCMRAQFPVATPDEQWRIGVGITYSAFTLGTPAPASVYPNSMTDNVKDPIKDNLLADSMINPWWEDFP